MSSFNSRQIEAKDCGQSVCQNTPVTNCSYKNVSDKKVTKEERQSHGHSNLTAKAIPSSGKAKLEACDSASFVSGSVSQRNYETRERHFNVKETHRHRKATFEMEDHLMNVSPFKTPRRAHATEEAFCSSNSKQNS